MLNEETEGDDGRGAEPGVEAPGGHSVEASILCTITRFGLRGARHSVPTYLDFRRVMRDVRRAETPGLLRATLLAESPRALVSLSIWEDLGSIGMFGTNVPLHVEAARRVFGRLAFSEGRGPELWSTKWRLVSVSNNLNWGDFDLRAQIRESRA